MIGYAKVGEVAAKIDGRLALVRSYSDGPLLFSLEVWPGGGSPVPSLVRAQVPHGSAVGRRNFEQRRRPARAIELVARRSGSVMGTVTLTIDAHGLPLECESLYPEAVAAVRSVTSKLGELSRLTCADLLCEGPLAMCAVYQLTLVHAHASGVDCLLAETPYKQASFMQQVFGFRRTCAEPRESPLGPGLVVLLQGRVRELQDRIAEIRLKGEGRNLLRNAFGAADEARLQCELQLANDAPGPSVLPNMTGPAPATAPITEFGVFA